MNADGTNLINVTNHLSYRQGALMGTGPNLKCCLKREIGADVMGESQARPVTQY